MSKHIDNYRNMEEMKDSSQGKVVVVSAVNIRKGGTLTVLRDCLRYLSELVQSAAEPSNSQSSAEPSFCPSASYEEEVPSRVIALVHDRKLCEYSGIEYIEIPWSTKSWLRRLWCEYVTMHDISKRLAGELGRPVDLWLSMHDTTPRVIALKQEVYCQTSFPFLKRRLRDLWMDPKVFLFSLFTKFAYKVNVRKNSSIIVQQEWFRDAMASMLNLPIEIFRVIPPATSTVSAGEAVEPVPAVETGRATESGEAVELVPAVETGRATESGGTGDIEKMEPVGEPGKSGERVKTFFYASTADCHKNFELLFEAARLLDAELGVARLLDADSGAGKFRVSVTICGNENRYARWLRRRWGNVPEIDWAGYLSKEELYRRYRSADCFVFPSRIETWGLPVTEYMSVSDGPVLISDLPYARETVASGRIIENRKIEYFSTENVRELADLMKAVLTA